MAVSFKDIYLKISKEIFKSNENFMFYSNKAVGNEITSHRN
jgi:hypothetical protein